ncbi:tyrosine--tRNA ligase [Patescibacteria group bacterium]|nr:tyrosine--tRNA ligase [Patescibacteria group bacterium]MBU1868122.1 tyrosine--tRNA ligase [Patescibacteria group bacterium]
MQLPKPTKEDLDHLLTYNIDTVYPSAETAREILNSGKQISIYLGVDPSSPNIHLGNAVVIRKLREFQQLGHKVIFLIGDFTGMIGDPTDKSAARVKLTPQQVKLNAKTYKKQVSLILNFEGGNPAEVRFNSNWLAELTFKDLVELASNFTVQQMIERDMYQERLKNNKPIYLHEFFYPLMQGYDCVAMDVDAEIGGTDQTFNMLAGRTLMKCLKNKEKLVFTCKLLVGSDGQKMSKSFGNMINVFDIPKNMYGKLMSVKDELMMDYLQMCTEFCPEELDNFKEQLAQGENPMEIKKVLAYTVTKFYHGEKKANQAENEFEKVVQRGDFPTDIPSVKINKKKIDLLELLTLTKLASSKSEAKRLIQQGAVEVDNQRVGDATLEFRVKDGTIIKAGKRKFVRITN